MAYCGQKAFGAIFLYKVVDRSNIYRQNTPKAKTTNLTGHNAAKHVVNQVYPPTVSKEPARNQTKQGIQARFQKKRKEVVSVIDLKHGRLGPVYQKER